MGLRNVLNSNRTVLFRTVVINHATFHSKDERLSVDDPKGISADSAAIYEHCEQASSERLFCER